MRLVLGAVLVGLSWGIAWGTDVPFLTPDPVSTVADGASSVHAADVDGDGDTDILSASFDDDTIAWYENTAGDGSAWTAHPIHVTTLGAVSVYAADVDGDGDIDAFSSSSTSGIIAWHENTAGDGSAWASHAISLAMPGAASVSAADVDGDGDTDALSASSGDDTIAWHENTAGDGSAWTTHVIEAAALGASSVHATDVDRDGDLDALSASSTDDTIAWYENTVGDGSAWTAHVISATASGARSVRTADMDADGDADALSASSSDDTVAWYENTAGDGSAWTAHVVDTTADSARAVLAADVDGDGDPDVLSASAGDDTIAWYENRTIHRSATFSTHFVANAGNFFLAHAADLNGDGTVDLLVGSTPGSSWYENTAGDGSTWVQRTINLVFDPVFDDGVRLDTADIDGDGDLDVLASYSEGSGTVAWHRNQGGFGYFWLDHVIHSGDDFRAMAADVDGDGDVDAVSFSETNRIVWHENLSGDGSTWSLHIIYASAVSLRSAHVADVDGDGDLDVLAASYGTHTVSWHENTAGDGSAWATHTISTVSLPFSVHAADLDGDGDIDAISSVESSGGEVLWHENTAGDGSTWAEHFMSNIPGDLSTDDVDGDGDPDVLVATNGELAWHENGTDWTRRVIGNVNRAFDVADVDGDGDSDIASGLLPDLQWSENRGGQFGFVTEADAMLEVCEDQVVSLLSIDLMHHGRAGDGPEELVELELLLEESPGDLLTAAEANALIETLSIYRDAGSDGFDPEEDVLVAEHEVLSPIAGVETFAFQDGDPNVQVPAFGTGRFFVVAEVASGASNATPNGFRITHLAASGGAVEDATYDIPLSRALSLNGTRDVSAEDVDHDGWGDGCDNCPQGFNPDQGPAPFLQTILATTPAVFSWTTPVDIVWVAGPLASVYRYATTDGGVDTAATSFFDNTTPDPGEGLYYLVRLGGDCSVATWQTVFGNEPDRDVELP